MLHEFGHGFHLSEIGITRLFDHETHFPARDHGCQALAATNRDRHRGLAARRIVGGERSNRKAGGLENTGTHPRKINQSPDGWRYDIDHGGLCRLRA